MLCVIFSTRLPPVFFLSWTYAIWKTEKSLGSFPPFNQTFFFWHSWDSSDGSRCVDILCTCKLTKPCRVLQRWPRTSSSQRHLTLMGTNYKAEYISVFTGLSLQTNYPRVTARRMLEILWELIPCPFHCWCRALPTEPHTIDKKEGGRAASAERERERGREGGREREREDGNRVCWIKKEKNEFMGAKTVKNHKSIRQKYGSTILLLLLLSLIFMQIAPKVLSLFEFFKYFTSILSPQCLHDVSYAELSQQAM